MIGRWTIYFNK